MKSFLWTVVFISVLFVRSPVPALAVDGVTGGSPKIGMVRVSKIFDAYERTKSSESQLETLSKSKQAEREQLVSEIKGMRDELVLLNEQARAEKQKAIEEKLKALAGFDQEAKESLRKKRDDALKGIFDEIEAAVKAYAKENGFTVVLNDQAVLYGVESIDVTDQVLAILNEKYAKAKR